MGWFNEGRGMNDTKEGTEFPIYCERLLGKSTSFVLKGNRFCFQEKAYYALNIAKQGKTGWCTNTMEDLGL